jgi:hypothetical protein
MGVFPALPPEYGVPLLTSGVSAWAQKNPANYLFVWNCVKQFGQQDWGCIPAEDAQLNRDELETRGGRIMGAYLVDPDLTDALDPKLWIICSGYRDQARGIDHCYTTVLWPSEY